MAAPSGDIDNGDHALNHDEKVFYYRQMKPDDKRIILIAVRSTMVNGRPKHGIFTELAKQLRFEPLTVS